MGRAGAVGPQDGAHWLTWWPFCLQAVEFLSKAVDSPNIKAVDEAVILLQEIGEWAGLAGHGAPTNAR